ncbi:MAG: TrkH family potassium uptake protein [Synergistaceae bacterium]|nr:TrkH family potassium uptake protein [Synergistaceae bacterium]
MRVLVVLKFLGFLTLVISAWMIVPLIYSAVNGETDAPAFAKSAALGAASGAALLAAGRGADMSKMGMREALMSVSMSWVIASAVGCAPYLLDGAAPTFADAFFEAMSGYTTTGSTILVNLESLPRGLLLWRALTHWLGGMGIIVLTLTVMPLIGVGGFQLYSAEAPGMVHEKITPRLQQTAAILWIIYLMLTAALAALLTAGGMSAYDAVTHAMGTISTGGFSPHGMSVAHFDSAYLDWVLIFFMFISGANFALHFHALRGRSLKSFFEDPEFRFYLALIASISAAVSLSLYRSGVYGTMSSALRFGTFQTVSLVTTTGFVSADYDVWPPFTKALLFVCLFLGGCAGSTSGAIKQARLLAMGRHIGRHLLRTLYPRAVLPFRFGSQVMEGEVMSSCMAFFGLYFLVFAAGGFLITLYEPDFVTAISGAATTLGNVGPGFARLGPTLSFADQACGAKWIYSFLMLCGRLELYTVLALFSGVFWRDGVTLSNGGKR